MTVAATVALELSRAMLCADEECGAVFSPQPACPWCASTIFSPLAPSQIPWAWLDRVRDGEGGQ